MIIIDNIPDHHVEIDGEQVWFQPIVQIRTIGYPDFLFGPGLRRQDSPDGRFVAAIDGGLAWFAHYECPRAVIAEFSDPDLDHLHDADVPTVSKIEKQLKRRHREARSDLRAAWDRGESGRAEKAIMHSYQNALDIIQLAHRRLANAACYQANDAKVRA